MLELLHCVSLFYNLTLLELGVKFLHWPLDEAPFIRCVPDCFSAASTEQHML